MKTHNEINSFRQSVKHGHFFSVIVSIAAGILGVGVVESFYLLMSLLKYSYTVTTDFTELAALYSVAALMSAGTLVGFLVAAVTAWKNIFWPTRISFCILSLFTAIVLMALVIGEGFIFESGPVKELISAKRPSFILYCFFGILNGLLPWVHWVGPRRAA